MISDGAKQIKTIKYFIEGSDRPEYGYKIKHEGSFGSCPVGSPQRKTTIADCGQFG